ncbi:DHA2 family efflux MFS transporter permease subunit [Micromonospora sp. 15K316]|uniref:MFS transporter n=1 Tax=Micromonospora sp. 15K316 TaxID=2530376 RepID=UPI00104B0AD9|nr:MFS transporter [Micromonospora sp. 15K316]TDC34078.1 DHA2 family efflux MFS transporter permease subunit [Micromonospora sp. 15K316]
MSATAAPNPRRWTALLVISLAQLMVVLDSTIVNIALPAAQHDLGFSDGTRQWVITAYTLAFGGLLLLGGRIADIAGRKRTFLVGLLGFAAASAIGGFAVNTGMLLGARALQGFFAALLAPAALSLVTVTFTDVRERAKAFGVFSAVAGGGGALGLILGGVLTEYLDWRWCLYVNVPITLVAGVGAVLVIRDVAHSRNSDRLDIPGALLASLGLVSLVYGFTRAETDGWTAAWTLGSFAAAVVLLAAFAVVESTVRAPLLPLRVVTERNRGGAFLGLGVAVIGMFGLLLFLTYYLQTVKHWSPVLSGVAFLPMVIGLVIGSAQIGPRLLHRVAPRMLMAPGFLAGALGMLLLTQLRIDSSYLWPILPCMVLLGLGLGVGFITAMHLAAHGVQPRDAGVASAMVNTSQQIGGSIGTALLNTIAAGSTAAWLTTHLAGRPTPQVMNEAAVHGYVTASWWTFGVMLAAAAIVVVFVNARREGGSAAQTGDEEGNQSQAPVLTH